MTTALLDLMEAPQKKEFQLYLKLVCAFWIFVNTEIYTDQPLFLLNVIGLPLLPKPPRL